MKPIPDVALIGAMKAGTTTLARQLDGHAQLAVARKHRPGIGMYNKEPGYFSRDERFALGEEWYRAHFAHAEPGQLTVDASTCYSRSQVYPNAIKRLHASNPKVRLIYVLRHPVERVYSHYLHDSRAAYFRGSTVFPFEEHLASDSHCLAASRYVDEVEQVYEWFSPDSLLCVRFEDLARGVTNLWEQVAAHLGVSREGFAQPIQPANQHTAAVARNAARQAVEGIVESGPARRFKTLVPRPVRRQMRSIATKLAMLAGAGQRARSEISCQVSPLTEELRRHLHAELDASTRRLGELLGWDVSDWLQVDRTHDQSSAAPSANC